MSAEPAARWSEVYLQARSREGRLLPDQLVAGLPDLPSGHPLHQEWRQRADSADRLCAYLRAQHRALRLLDAGCGNGWLAHRLAAIDGTTVIGVDLDGVELDQARRVFGGRPHVEFVAGDLLDGVPDVGAPDVVVLASVIQYLGELGDVLDALLALMRPGAEIHVVDSPIYRRADVAAARERTRRHYAVVGVPQMALHYHHHCWDELAGVAFDVLYRPDDWRHRAERRLLRRPRSPFPWIRIRAGRRR